MTDAGRSWPDHGNAELVLHGVHQDVWLVAELLEREWAVWPSVIEEEGGTSRMQIKVSVEDLARWLQAAEAELLAPEFQLQEPAPGGSEV